MRISGATRIVVVYICMRLRQTRRGAVNCLIVLLCKDDDKCLSYKFFLVSYDILPMWHVYFPREMAHRDGVPLIKTITRELLLICSLEFLFCFGKHIYDKLFP